MVLAALSEYGIVFMTPTQRAVIFQPVLIGPIAYKVMSRTSTGNNGLINFERCDIRLRVSLCYDKTCATLWHEIIHGIDDNINLGLTEEQTDRLAHALLDVLRKNPHLGDL